MVGGEPSNPWLLALIPFVFSGLGAYLGSYLKKKGENLATKEDIKDVVEQVRAVTTVTEEIRTKISNEAWDRQKRWELKREVLFEVTKRLGPVTDATTKLHAFYQTQKENPGPISPHRQEERLKLVEEWGEAASQFDNASIFVDVVCGREAWRAVADFSVLVRGIRLKLGEGNPDAFLESIKEFTSKMGAVTEMVRKQLASGGQS